MLEVCWDATQYIKVSNQVLVVDVVIQRQAKYLGTEKGRQPTQGSQGKI